MSGTVTMGAIEKLGVLKNHYACNIMSKMENWLLKFEVKKNPYNDLKKKKKKMDSQVCINDTSIIPDSSKHFSQKALDARL